MLPEPIQLATTSNGKRYIVKSIQNQVIGRKQVPHIVVVLGDIIWVSGFSASHGPDKKFKFDRVTITDAERTEELLLQLLDQDKL